MMIEMYFTQLSIIELLNIQQPCLVINVVNSPTHNFWLFIVNIYQRNRTDRSSIEAKQSTVVG